LHRNVFQDTFHDLSLGHFFRKLWVTQRWVHWMSASF
jgi:hypothetical protein